MTEQRVHMLQTLKLLNQVTEIIERLDGTRVNVEAKSKDLNTQKAQISKELLYAAHLVDMARLGVMNEYHKFKGERPPRITIQ